MEIIKISIKEMVEFICRSGHISNEMTNHVRALEGTRIHQKIQREQDAYYQSEVSLNYEIEKDDFHYIFQGRMDGLIIKDDQVSVSYTHLTLPTKA